MTRKICSKCSVTKSTSEFHKCKASKDGLQYRCKSCCSEYSKQHKLNNALKGFSPGQARNNTLTGLSRDNKDKIV